MLWKNEDIIITLLYHFIDQTTLCVLIFTFFQESIWACELLFDFLFISVKYLKSILRKICHE